MSADSGDVLYMRIATKCTKVNKNIFDVCLCMGLWVSGFLSFTIDSRFLCIYACRCICNVKRFYLSLLIVYIP